MSKKESVPYVDLPKGSTGEKSFTNLQRFLGHMTAPIVPCENGQTPDYSNRNIYFPPIQALGRQKVETYYRNFEMLGRYVGFDEETYEDVGSTHGVTRQRAEQVVKKAFRMLENSAPTGFPTDDIAFHKPLGIENRHKASRSKGGKSNDIAEMLANGASIQDLKKRFSQRQLIRARKTLKEWGITLEREREPVLSRFIDLGNSKLPDEKIQKLLNQISNSRVISILKNAGTVSFVSETAEDIGIRAKTRNTHLLLSALKGNSIPFGRVSNYSAYPNNNVPMGGHYYYVHATIHTDRVKEALQNDPSLAHLRT